jgi:hypothetical protein
VTVIQPFNEIVDFPCPGRAEKMVLDQRRKGYSAFWHSARLSSRLARVYADPGVKYVLLEAYWPWKSRLLLWLFIGGSIRRAKRAGIIDKLIVVLGTNTDRTDLWSYIPWCNDEKTLRAQTEYVKKSGAGIGMYVHWDMTENWFKTIDEVFR